jgi:hypothetical protein
MTEAEKEAAKRSADTVAASNKLATMYRPGFSEPGSVCTTCQLCRVRAIRDEAIIADNSELVNLCNDYLSSRTSENLDNLNRYLTKG